MANHYNPPASVFILKHMRQHTFSILFRGNHVFITWPFTSILEADTGLGMANMRPVNSCFAYQYTIFADTI
jgi:hypothetical protein